MIDEASKSTVENQEDAWSLFLSRFEIFMSVIDAASAVCYNPLVIRQRLNPLELNPYARLAWSILSLIPKVLLGFIRLAFE